MIDARMFRRAGKAQSKALRRLKARLEANPYFGERVRDDLLPARFRHMRHVHRLSLPDGWRALYSVSTQEGNHEVAIFGIGSHPEYDRLFGYKRS